MTLDDIEIFVKVVDCKSFSKAAHLLRLPKSTVSRRIAQTAVLIVVAPV
ncbi:MAG: LysR family transcriptional regulator [Alphaproteobacteria bacterium]|nr:LysR family transcriptional regulator [Alphaproteobacteria bacterium]